MQTLVTIEGFVIGKAEEDVRVNGQLKKDDQGNQVVKRRVYLVNPLDMRENTTILVSEGTFKLAQVNKEIKIKAAVQDYAMKDKDKGFITNSGYFLKEVQ